MSGNYLSEIQHTIKNLNCHLIEYDLQNWHVKKKLLKSEVKSDPTLPLRNHTSIFWTIC